MPWQDYELIKDQPAEIIFFSIVFMIKKIKMT